MYFYLPFSSFWQRFHITCLENFMQRAAQVRFAEFVYGEPMVVIAGDNMAAQGAMVTGTKSVDMAVVEMAVGLFVHLLG